MSNVLLPIPPDGVDATNPPGRLYVNGTAHLLFDASTAEICYWKFRLPDDYTGSPTLKVQYAMTSATTGTVAFDAQIMAVTPNDAADIDTASFDTTNEGTETVPGTAGYMHEVTITLTNADSMAAGDWVTIKFYRDATDATNDTAAGDAEVHTVTLVYA